MVVTDRPFFRPKAIELLLTCPEAMKLGEMSATHLTAPYERHSPIDLHDTTLDLMGKLV